MDIKVISPADARKAVAVDSEGEQGLVDEYVQIMLQRFNEWAPLYFKETSSVNLRYLSAPVNDRRLMIMIIPTFEGELHKAGWGGGVTEKPIDNSSAVEYVLEVYEERE